MTIFMEVSFNDLPQQVQQINSRLVRIEAILKQQNHPKKSERPIWLTLEELRSYLPQKPAKQTVYGWVNRRRIPYHKRGKKLFFSKKEIDKWLTDGRRVTVSEIQDRAIDYLK